MATTPKNNPTTRHAMLAINAERLNHLDDPLEWLEQQTQTLPHLDNYGIILHDLDVGGDHYHVAIKLTQPMRLKAIADTYGQQPNIVEMWTGQVDNMWSYLTHQTKKAKAEKADYTPYLHDTTKSRWDSTDTQEKARHKKIAKKTDNQVDLLAEQLILGTITKRELLQPDTVMTYWKNKTKLDRAMQVRTEALMVNPPNCKTYYIYGKSRTGKSSYARAIAEEKYPNQWAFASAGNDPLQDYMGEKCLILDDFRPQDYPLNQLLALIDPYHRNRTHKSRYYNKGLATELILITNVAPLEDVVDYYTAYTKEDPRQITARIHKTIDMNDLTIKSE